MKQILLFFICLTLHLTAWCQTTDYYTGKNEIQGNQYIYTIEMRNSYFLLQSIDNIKFNTPQYNVDGVTPTDYRMAGQAFDIDKNAIYKIFRDVFSDQEIQQFKLAENNELIEIMHVVSMNGNVIEVQFAIPNTKFFKSIPPDKFYQLEQKIKEQLKFFVSPNEKRVNYIKGKKTTVYIDEL